MTQEGIETVGGGKKKEVENIELTEADKLVLERMNKSWYVIYVNDSEWLSINGVVMSVILKAGTIKRLMDFGLIEVSPVNYTRHLLTDKGRTFR